MAIVCEAIEGLARAQGLLKLPEAWGTFLESQHVCRQLESQGEIAVLRRIQILRTQVDMFLRLEGADKKVLVDIGRRGIWMAREHGYLRHALLMDERLKKLGVTIDV